MTLIAVDTNVLLRYVLRDDEQQADRARRLIDEADSVLVTDVVLVETVWTLTGRKYCARKPDVTRLVERLMQDPGIRFEDDQVVWRALQSYRDTDAGFSDAMIVHKAMRVAADQGEALLAVHTFDRAFEKLPHAQSG